MASPQPENGYTAIAHEILEATAKTQINATQLRILLVIWRYTYGFKRKSHELSETFISQATDIHRKQIQRELNDLIKKNIVIIEREATFTLSRVLRFNKDYDSWVVANQLPGSKTVTHTGSELVTSPGSELVTQETKLKENIKESIVPYKKIVELYHELCPSLSKVRGISGEREKHIGARFKQYGNNLEVFTEIFTKAEKSNFLKGKSNPKDGKKPFKADFDWLMNEANMVKVLEDKYKNQDELDKSAASNFIDEIDLREQRGW